MFGSYFSTMANTNTSTDGSEFVDVVIRVNTEGGEPNHGGFASGDEITGEVVVKTPKEARVKKANVFFTGACVP